MRFVWLFTVILILKVVEGDDAPGFFLKTTKNIPRVKFYDLK